MPKGLQQSKSELFHDMAMGDEQGMLLDSCLVSETILLSYGESEGFKLRRYSERPGEEQ